MTELLQTLRKDKILRDIDVYFAENICAIFNVPDDGMLTFALVLNATEGGDTCLDLSNPQKISFYEQYKTEIDYALSNSTIKMLMDAQAVCKAPCTGAPFILAEDKLYMKSFYNNELVVADFIRNKTHETNDLPASITALLDAYFTEDSMQKAAAMNAAVNSFSVISGGPGTGKTTTVFKLLAVLCEISEKPLKIAVCAPTGKAASRLTESIQEQREKYKDKGFISQIPEKAQTVHRLLGMYGDTRKPLFNKDNKLPYDIIITDEASMVDIKMMSKLVEAVPESSRLILLGDKDQLASVQPGAVLGDICSYAPVETFTPERAELLSKLAGKNLDTAENRYADISIMLDKSWRFESSPEIGLLASASGKGDYQTTIDVLSNSKTGNVRLIQLDDSFEEITGKFILDQYTGYHKADNPAEAINEFNRFRILSPIKKGNGSTEHINAIANKILFRKGLIDSTKQFYHGLPIMIVENDHSLGLFNGETGLVFGSHEQKACFALDKETIRHITPARLPDNVHAYSMTVHKSQGSEFDHVVFVLPDSDGNIMTRELFYTAVTRAKTKLTVISTPEAIKNCLTRRIERSSGLKPQV